MTFGEKLSMLRKENNCTQEQPADTLGVSRQAVSKMALIIIGIVLAAILVVCLITFISIIGRFHSMPDDDFERQCMLDSCEASPIDEGLYCEEHTCIAR